MTWLHFVCHFGWVHKHFTVAVAVVDTGQRHTAYKVSIFLLSIMCLSVVYVHIHLMSVYHSGASPAKAGWKEL